MSIKLAKKPARSARITTFYSYKGGTGRSMALANYAWILAAHGKRVLVIDWDLEAPGLHRYFRPFLIDPELRETDGLVDAVWALTSSAVQRAANAPRNEFATVDVGEALDDVTRRLRYEHFPHDGYIDFICAGRQSETYSERVNTFDWKRFYELGGARILSELKSYLRPRYDVILVDSRTGVSDTSGICTIQLPDQVVGCFTLNRQSIDGVASVLRSIRVYRSPSVDGSKIALYPLATRIENNEQKRLESARKYARKAMSEFLPAMHTDGRGYWDRMELAYRPAYAFEEILAAFGDATGAEGAADTFAAHIELVSRCVSGDDSLRIPEVLPEDRGGVLAKYALAGTDAEAAPSVETLQKVDGGDSQFLRDIVAKEQHWRSHGYDWRALMSRRELDLLTAKDRETFGRTMNYYVAQSERAQKFMRQLDIGYSIWLVGGIAAVGAIVLQREWSQLTRAMYGAYAAALAFIVIGAILSRSQARPYGVRLIHDLNLLALTPLRPEIRDYQAPRNEALRRTKASQMDNARC